MYKKTFLVSIRGFTLIELLIVIGVIGILVGVIINIINVQTQIQKANFVKVESDLKAIQDAVELYYEDNNKYPDDKDSQPDPSQNMPDEMVGKNYIAKWPVPPCPGWHYDWDNKYPDGSPNGEDPVRITVSDASGNPIYFLCVKTQHADCNYAGTGGGTDILQDTRRRLVCSD